MSDFVNIVLLPILSTALTAIVAYIGVKLKAIFERIEDDKTKNEAANTCVRAIEQLYKDLHGEEKYNKCLESLTAMLNEKGITVTDIELKMLIESAVHRLNHENTAEWEAE
ncbi:MAG: holin [Oscillospiraceae bacterium]|nr:holin [Oscillospiraceae bacterium]